MSLKSGRNNGAAQYEADRKNGDVTAPMPKPNGHKPANGGLRDAYKGKPQEKPANPFETLPPLEAEDFHWLAVTSMDDFQLDTDGYDETCGMEPFGEWMDNFKKMMWDHWCSIETGALDGFEGWRILNETRDYRMTGALYLLDRWFPGRHSVDDSTPTLNYHNDVHAILEQHVRKSPITPEFRKLIETTLTAYIPECDKKVRITADHYIERCGNEVHLCSRFAPDASLLVGVTLNGDKPRPVYKGDELLDYLELVDKAGREHRKAMVDKKPDALPFVCQVTRPTGVTLMPSTAK